MDDNKEERKLDPQLQKLFEEMQDGLDKCIDDALATFNRVRQQKEKELRRRLGKSK